MNRIILIGNGFDLAHGMKTSYRDFINNYWVEFALKVLENIFMPYEDELVCFKKNSGPDSMYKAQIATSYGVNNKNHYKYRDAFNNGIIPDFYEKLEKVDCYNTFEHLILDTNEVSDFQFTLIFKNSFWEQISKNKSDKNWVDIENEYYEKLKKCSKDEAIILNQEFKIIEQLLEKYLNQIQDKSKKVSWTLPEIRYKICSLLSIDDLSKESSFIYEIESEIKELKILNINILSRVMKDCRNIYNQMKTNANDIKRFISNYHEELNINKESAFDYIKKEILNKSIPDYFLFPKSLLFLNFNYTDTSHKYDIDKIYSTIHIHGKLNNPKNPIIFGYGDELSENYKQIENLNDNEFLKNVKSIRYLETDNYRRLLNFIESEPYQIFIMGHSCGNSDRTLLNTLFEHKNCVSIKPFYRIREDGSDNYNEIVQNISRNFTNKAAMRERVVNKTYCEPLT